MTYLSRPDRRAETEPAEERAVVLDLAAHTAEEHNDPHYTSWAKCPRCGRVARSHRPAEIARCDAAYDAEMQRRRTGPARIGDVAGRRA